MTRTKSSSKWINGGLKIIVWLAGVVFLAGVLYASVEWNGKNIEIERERNNKQDDKIQKAEVERTRILAKLEEIHDDIKEMKK